MQSIFSHNWNFTLKKIGISSVAQQFDTFFEDAAKASVEELRKKIEVQRFELTKSYEKLAVAQDEQVFSQGENQYDTIPSDEVQEQFSEVADYEHEISLLKEKLLALMEMQVISLYKNYEIAQKELVSTAYEGINVRDLYLWDNVKAFFNSKGFNFGRIQGYDHINQLRIVNNNIKHSPEIDVEVHKLKLKCFEGLIYFTADSLEEFYKRVSKEVPKFLVTLSELIIKDLYEYDDKRLEKIAKSYTEKMDKATLRKLSLAIDKQINELPIGSVFN
ncbi:hypothetical protein [Vibrio atlanticus]|uniref:hypothetical protein n=1 Tax=Vibrio atlanticus TaxID=693153 RepID=UPI003CF65B13